LKFIGHPAVDIIITPSVHISVETDGESKKWEQSYPTKPLNGQCVLTPHCIITIFFIFIMIIISKASKANF
jgi:hypothetical protein